jgi:hypothetical protein
MAMAPANYSGLANLMNLQGVGVNPTSQLAYVPSKDLMTRYQTIPNPSTGIPQAMGVTGMAEGGMPSQQYPMQEEAMELANRGRYGDTTLVHMTPGEVQGLASLGQLTINPDTGLPEAFNMKSLLPIIGGIAGSFLLPGAGTALGSGLGATAIGAGLGTTAGGLLAGQKPGDALLSGILSGGMSYVGGLALGAEGLTPLTAGGGEIVTTAGGLDPTAAAMAAGQGPTGAATVGQAMQAIDPTAAAMNVGDFGKLVTPETQLISKTVPTFEGYSVPAREPNLIQRALGIDAEPAKIIPKSDLMGEVASRQLTDPLTYAPLGVAALTGAFDDPYEYKEPARPPKDSGFGDYSLVGGEERNPETAKEIQSRMLAGGVRPSYFSPTQRYVRNDAPNETSSIKRNGFR